MSRVDPTRWLEHLARHVPLALEGSDPEGVHQVRVAGRRLRVWLTLGEHRTLDDDLRWLIRGLSPARDYDVLLATPLGSGGAFADWLRAQRDAGAAVARAVLQDGRVTALLESLPHLPWPSVKKAHRVLEKLEQRLTRHGEAWRTARETSRDDGAVPGLPELHRARRSLRKVRYARDWLDLDTGDLPARQDALGAVCDVNALWGHVAQWIEATDAQVPESWRALRATLESMLDVLEAH